MADFKAVLCDMNRHMRAGTCDCTVCGWHVWDGETVKNASGEIVIDGQACLANHPRADAYKGASH